MNSVIIPLVILQFYKDSYRLFDLYVRVKCLFQSYFNDPIDVLTHYGSYRYLGYPNRQGNLSSTNTEGLIEDAVDPLIENRVQWYDGLFRLITHYEPSVNPLRFNLQYQTIYV